MVSLAVATVASVTGLLRAWPQAWAILRQGHATGVSAQAWTLVLISNLIWLMLGGVADIPVTVAYNVAGGAGTAAVVVLLCRQGVARTSAVLAALVVATGITLAVAAAWSAPGVGVLAVGIAVTMYLPQAYKTLRQPATAVSRTSWGLALISVACWGWYGLMIDEPAFIASAAVMVPTSAVILWRAQLAQAHLRGAGVAG